MISSLPDHKVPKSQTETLIIGKMRPAESFFYKKELYIFFLCARIKFVCIK